VPRKKTLKLEHVLWRDASSKDTWHNINNCEGEYFVSSVGYVLKDNKKVLVICSSYCDSDKSSGNSLTIPKGMVLKRTKIAHKNK